MENYQVGMIYDLVSNYWVAVVVWSYGSLIATTCAIIAWHH
jgi:hypothetical protein